VAGAIARLRAAGIQVLHAVGPKNELPEAPEGEGLAAYRPVPYLDRMDLAYAAADLAVCRAGAMTVAELSAVGLPAVYVPLPIGNGEQRLNALPVVRAGGGIVVEDAEFDGDRLAAEATRILGDPARLSSMSMAASRFGRRDADDRLVAMVRQAAASAPTGRAARRRQRSGTETTA
jgi:UDP-N-acetylglucosamine--N-acetylmuramyl-(pentapeptide) pyrophosphoryl-undecaprenol N-acetylglucosamine transferase